MFVFGWGKGVVKKTIANISTDGVPVELRTEHVMYTKTSL